MVVELRMQYCRDIFQYSFVFKNDEEKCNKTSTVKLSKGTG